MQNNYQLFKYLSQIKKYGSISSVAKKNNVSPSFLRKTIKNFEKDLKGQLIITASGGRNGGSSHLTKLAHSIIKSDKNLKHRDY